MTINPQKMLWKLAVIKAVFKANKAKDAYDNLLGAYLDIKRDGKADEVSLDTISRVLGQLSKIRDQISKD